MIDCRFLPNPYWVDDLRPLPGLDPVVQDYVNSFELTEQFLDRLTDLLELLLPAYRGRGQGVPDHRARVHRRPSPLGRHRRGRRPTGCGRRASSSASRHRDVGKMNAT